MRVRVAELGDAHDGDVELAGERGELDARSQPQLLARGLLGYLAILGSLFRDTETTRSITALLALCGLAFSAWLTHVEVFELNAICIWCVGSAVCMVVLAALATTRLLRAPTP